MIPSGVLVIARDLERVLIEQALAVNRPALVTGEAGIGKTALVSAAVAATGRSLIRGAGFATLAGMPYVPLRHALGATVQGPAERVARRVEAALEGGVLFLDDLQWTDRHTLAVVQFLVGRIGLVLAARDPLDPRALGLPGDIVEIRLRPLDRDAAAAVVHGVRPALAGPALDRLLQRAAGNPLLLQELARDGRPSATLARAIAARVAAASPEARDALRLLAVSDRPIALPLTDAVLHELRDGGLALADGAGLAIRHALIADAILDGLSPDERTATHARIARLVIDDALAAHHLARAGDHDAAVQRAHGALTRTTDRRERAVLLRVAAEASSGPDAAARHIDAARAAIAVEEHAVAVELLAAELGGDDETQALREALLARAHGYLGRTDERDAALARAAAYAVHPSGEAAHILSTELALVHTCLGDLNGGLAVLDEAEARDHDGSSPWRRSRASVRATIRFLAGGDADIPALRAAVDEAIAAGSPSATALAANFVSVLLAALGPGPALEWADEVIPRLDAAGVDASRLHADRIQLLIFVGRATEAVVDADHLLGRPYPFHARGWTLVQRAEAQTQLGHLADAEATLEAAEPMLADEWMDRGEAATTRSQLAYWSGRTREAVDAAGRALAVPSHYDGNYLLPALVRAWAQVEVGQAPDPLPPATSSWLQAGASAEWTGIAALAAGDAATDAFDTAAERWAGRHVFRAAVCRWAAADAARRAGAVDTVDRLTAVLESAEEHGFELLAARVRRSLRLAGVRVARSRPVGHGRGSLTPRERELLELVAAGHSNAEIGRRMGLGRGTVIRTVSSAMAKLGATSRAHAVTLLSSHE